MISILRHEGLNGNLLNIVDWVKQFGKWCIVDIKDIPSINEGIIVAFDMPMHPTSAYKMSNPSTELGQTESQQLMDYHFDLIQVPIIFFGSFLPIEKLGGSLNLISSKTRIRNIKIASDIRPKGEYWAKGKRIYKVQKYPDNMDIWGRYIGKSIFTEDVVAFSVKDVWCCNTTPYKFENLEGSHYKKQFNLQYGDPFSNILMAKVYEKKGIQT